MEDLTAEELSQLKNEFKGMKAKFDEIYYALVGNKIGGDGGIVQRVRDAENELEELRIKIEHIERNSSKNETYVKILWAAGGIISGAVLGFIIQQILTIKK